MSPDPSSSMNQQANNKKEEEQFPIKLHRILEEAEANGFSDCISWMPDGTSFKIFDKTRLENEVMPQYFESCQFKSFQRSLNMWGFVADNKKSDTTTGGGRRHHPLFVKGRPELCCAMRRVRVKKPGARGKKVIEEANKLSTTPPDSPTTTGRHEESTNMTSGFLAPCRPGDRYDQAIMFGNVSAPDNCSDLVQQLCQSQSNGLLVHALLATQLQQGRPDQERSTVLPSHPAELPTDFVNRSLLAAALAKMLNTATTTTSRTAPLQQHLLPPFIGQPPTAPVNHRGFSNENIDEATLRQAAIALATAGWNSPSPSKNAEYFVDPQYCDKLLMMNMLLQQEQASTHTSSIVITDAIRNNLVRGGESSSTTTSHNSHDGGGGSSTGGTSSPRQNIMNGGVSLQPSTLPTPAMSTLDLASSLLLQRYSVMPGSS